MEKEINSLKKAIRKSDRVTVMTGAGISAESGVPTFRGAEGLWKNYQATDLATPEAFAAKSGGALVAEINLERTPNSDLMDFVLIGKAGEIVPRLVETWA